MADKLSNTGKTSNKTSNKASKAVSSASSVGAGAGDSGFPPKLSPDLSPGLSPELAPLELAVFPLPLFILPGGIQRLRIFEPRYLAMVAEAMVAEAKVAEAMIAEERATEPEIVSPKTNISKVKRSKDNSSKGFVIARYDKEHPYDVPIWGTRVQVIDFHNGDDGILVIDVKGTGLVDLSEFRYRTDRLLLAKAQPRAHWPASPCFDGGGELGERLTQFIEKHPLLAEHYSQREFNDMSWICGRFLELLPLSLNDKEKFVTPTMLEPLKVFLHTFILGETQASH
ncbi:hypothetical protein LZP69_09915 [Shewanella sp. AS1]|uniref:LON peptidase substrate-binding domain-containing protein n=1 Tax=Shewanella sp. AS1 TaxID=2907626 RepID=UPI001F30759F|nr:LON peptidase substrate-binding domain-containing protein [Shewanella sp. AS1]MCE9679476.1 hypothetical protein [Shewanella sp. AS1]